MQHRPAALLCAGCRAFYFCNDECQKNAWGSHKMMCKQIKMAGSGNRRRFRELGIQLCKNVHDKAEMLRICSLIAKETRNLTDEDQWDDLVEQEVQQRYENCKEEEKQQFKEVVETMMRTTEEVN